MVQAGMTPMQALTAATVTAAAHIGQADHLGVLAPGKLADLIAFAKSPLDDIAETMRPVFVMRDGHVFKRT